MKEEMSAEVAKLAEKGLCPDLLLLLSAMTRHREFM